MKECYRRKRSLRWGFVLLLLSVCIIGANARFAKAEESLFWKTYSKVYVGDKIKISDYFNRENVQIVSYEVENTEQGQPCISLEADGMVTAQAPGKNRIKVTYLYAFEQEDGDVSNDAVTVTVSEYFSVEVLETESKTAAYGDNLELEAFSCYSYEEVVYQYENDAVLVDGEGNYFVQGFRDFKVYINTKYATNVLVASVTVKKPSFGNAGNFVRAKGTDGVEPQISSFTSLSKYTDMEKIDCQIADSSIATVKDSCIFALSVGKTAVTIAITAGNGDTMSLSGNLIVTDPKLVKSQYVLAAGTKKALQLSGISKESVISMDLQSEEEDDDYYGYYDNSAYIKDKMIYAEYEGTVVIKFMVDGRILNVKVIVTDPRFEGLGFPMYKGMKKAISLKGMKKGYSKASYKSTNTKIATVNKNGVVCAKKVGVTRVIATVDGRKVTVWLEIAAKKAYQAAKKEIAISKTKTVYSQARRMSKGSYDCSSLVSRVYRKYGVYFGVKKGWSPTAAGIGQWCASHKKVISTKAVSYTKLVPGDLIFYSYTKNGRYRNISHIEMYVGNGMSVSASSSNNRVIHYGYSTYRTVLVARPVK